MINKTKKLLFIICYFTINLAEEKLFEVKYYYPTPSLKVMEEWVKNLNNQKFYFVKNITKSEKEILQNLIDEKVKETENKVQYIKQIKDFKWLTRAAALSCMSYGAILCLRSITEGFKKISGAPNWLNTKLQRLGVSCSNKDLFLSIASVSIGLGLWLGNTKVKIKTIKNIDDYKKALIIKNIINKLEVI